MLLSLFKRIPTANVTVVTSKPDLFEVYRWTIFIQNEQGWLELKSSLVNRHRVPDITGGWIRYDLVGCAVQRDFKLTNAIDTVEQTKKVDRHTWSTEGLCEIFHECHQFLVLLGRMLIPLCLLEIAECLPGKLNHFFIASRQETQFVDHFSEKARRVSTTRETENVDMIPRVIVLHDKAVPS